VLRQPHQQFGDRTRGLVVGSDGPQTVIGRHNSLDNLVHSKVAISGGWITELYDPNIEELQDALDNVDGKKPTQRLLAAIAYKNGRYTDLDGW